MNTAVAKIEGVFGYLEDNVKCEIIKGRGDVPLGLRVTDPSVSVEEIVRAIRHLRLMNGTFDVFAKFAAGDLYNHYRLAKKPDERMEQFVERELGGSGYTKQVKQWAWICRAWPDWKRVPLSSWYVYHLLSANDLQQNGQDFITGRVREAVAGRLTKEGLKKDIKRWRDRQAACGFTTRGVSGDIASYPNGKAPILQRVVGEPDHQDKGVTFMAGKKSTSADTWCTGESHSSRPTDAPEGTLSLPLSTLNTLREYASWLTDQKGTEYDERRVVIEQANNLHRNMEDHMSVSHRRW